MAIHTGNQFILIVVSVVTKAEATSSCMIEQLAIQPGGQPTLGGMTIVATIGENTSVLSWFFMARNAVGGNILEGIFRMWIA